MSDLLNAGESGSAYSNTDFGNRTLTCAARNIQGPVDLPFPPLVPLVSRCLLIIYYMFLVVYATLLNGLVVYLVCVYKQLRTLDFLLALQIAIVHILGSALLLSVALSSVIANQWLLGEPMCILFGIFNLYIAITRTLLLLVFVVNRFCNVFLTYSYPKYRTKVAVGLNLGVYVITMVMCSVPIALDCFSFSATVWNCRNTSSCNSLCAGYQQILGFVIYIPSSILSVVLYVALFCKGWKARKSLPVAANDLAGDQN